LAVFAIISFCRSPKASPLSIMNYDIDTVLLQSQEWSLFLDFGHKFQSIIKWLFERTRKWLPTDSYPLERRKRIPIKCRHSSDDLSKLSHKMSLTLTHILSEMENQSQRHLTRQFRQIVRRMPALNRNAFPSLQWVRISWNIFPILYIYLKIDFLWYQYKRVNKNQFLLT
jgi:hypothetical protein